jgi:hypothetical protein
VSPPARLRLSRTALMPVIVLAICCMPLAAVAAPWSLLLLLVPVALAVWVFRVGVDVSDDGLAIRSLAGRREVPWGEVSGIRVGRRGDLWVVTRQATEVRLPVLRARDLPRLAELSGGWIPAVHEASTTPTHRRSH